MLRTSAYSTIARLRHRGRIASNPREARRRGRKSRAALQSARHASAVFVECARIRIARATVRELLQRETLRFRSSSAPDSPEPCAHRPGRPPRETARTQRAATPARGLNDRPPLAFQFKESGCPSNRQHLIVGDSLLADSRLPSPSAVVLPLPQLLPLSVERGFRNSLDRTKAADRQTALRLPPQDPTPKRFSSLALLPGHLDLPW